MCGARAASRPSSAWRASTIACPPSTTEAELLQLIARLNGDPAVHGILVQLPLPKHIDTPHVLLAVDPDKDVDGFHPINVGRLGSLAAGAPLDFPVPCTPLGCSMLLADTLGALAGKDAVIVGRSTLVGRPVAQLLLRADCTVTIAHSRTRDLPALCRTADILVVAIGKPEFVRGDWIKPGAAVIDVGINRVPAGGGKTKLVGDVAFDEARAGRGPSHAGAGRRRPDDRRLPDVQHPAGSAPPRRPALRGGLIIGRASSPRRRTADRAPHRSAPITVTSARCARSNELSSSAFPRPARSRCGASSPRRSGRGRPGLDSASL